MEIQSYLLAGGVDNTAKKNDPASVDSAFAALLAGETDEQVLHNYGGKGIDGMMAERIKALKKKITEEVMASKNLTVEEIATMPADQRINIEKQIMDEVQQKLVEAMREEMRKKDGTLLGSATPVDPDGMAILIDSQKFYGL